MESKMMMYVKNILCNGKNAFNIIGEMITYFINIKLWFFLLLLL